MAWLRSLNVIINNLPGLLPTEGLESCLFSAAAAKVFSISELFIKMMEVLNNIQRQTEAEVAEIKRIENGKNVIIATRVSQGGSEQTDHG